jgi:hypothetical protein
MVCGEPDRGRYAAYSHHGCVNVPDATTWWDWANACGGAADEQCCVNCGHDQELHQFGPECLGTPTCRCQEWEPTP